MKGNYRHSGWALSSPGELVPTTMNVYNFTLGDCIWRTFSIRIHSGFFDLFCHSKSNLYMYVFDKIS